MFSVSLVVAVLLSAGDEPKPFQAAPEQVQGVSNPAFTTPVDELQYLRKNRPRYYGASAVLGAGAVVSAIGIGLAIFSWGIRDEGQVFGLLIGGSVFGLGALLGIGGGIAMGVIGAEQTRIDARIRALEMQLGAPAPSVRIPILPPVVLARF